ncbi:BCD family chlorophyll transporter-like MFS transporter [Roseibium hamelinense]|uniref:BCD family chlorophyll transporter-like MFS transporter n=1 Tax=Roseibium hamelinense TaxID=150831 RepID=A0A562SYZ7_9HYPH|nr:BCD family MFS transporter [Roseibium hamelinense]MTI44870.1 MFS transporter [Roseibium hamelinense]TWI85936.1 BCD family chlorophyll transporter-like MFS transporter [Roseibium hamelinense]
MHTLRIAKPAISLSWLAIMRLGLVQAALGSVIVLTTSTLNRVLIVELSLAAVIPGLLVGLHYAVQISRPVWGHKSDNGGNRTVWIIGGMCVLAASGTAASASALLMETKFGLGLASAILAFAFIGFGVGACGTSLLALLASKAAPERRAAAATIVWMMMIAGIVITAIVSGSLLDPFSFERLIGITGATGLIAIAVTCLAVAGVERMADTKAPRPRKKRPFIADLKETWNDSEARLFTVFVFMSMLAYSTQDLILEPFGGLLFGLTPGETTKLSGAQHGGILLGMALVGILGTLLARKKARILRHFTIWGCVCSAIALGALAIAAFAAPDWPLAANIFLLGLANGVFAVAAIGTMMMLASQNGGEQAGIRMGVWGAAQALSFGLGGLMGTVLLDAARALTKSDAHSFMSVFGFEAVLFVMSALVATGLRASPSAHMNHPSFSTDPVLEAAE